MGWYPCCCGGIPCNACSGKAPEQFAMIFGGVINGSCSCISQLGGFYVLDFVGYDHASWPTPNCYWYLDTGTTFCGFINLTMLLVVYTAGSNWTIDLFISPFSTTYSYTAVGGGAADCLDVAGWALPYSTPVGPGSPVCDLTSSTVDVAPI